MTHIEPEKRYRSSRLMAWLAPKRLGRQAIIETLLLVALVLTIGWWVSPKDPLLVQASFPWLWLVPLVLALRYGSAISLLSAALLLAFWFLWRQYAQPDINVPASFFLGGLIFTLVAGEFSDIWHARLRRVSSVNKHLNTTIKSLTNRHYLLHLAYAQLEQEMLVKPVTLRDAIQRLRRLVVDDPKKSPLPKAHDFLNLVGQACRLDEASLHIVRHSKPVADAAATIGISGSQLDLSDPMVDYALAQRQLTHVQSENVDADQSRYVIVAPLITSDDELIGLLAVSRLPFLSLNEETLRFIAVLVGYYADVVKLGATIKEVLRLVPECRLLFAGELVRLHRVYQEVGIPSLLTAMTIAPGLHQAEIAKEVLRQSRDADMSWECWQGNYYSIFTLMPLSSSKAYSGYIQRRRRWLEQRFGITDLGQAGIGVHSVTIGNTPPPILLADLLCLCESDQSTGQPVQQPVQDTTP